MKLLSMILTGIVAAEHLYILWLEMFAWETAGKKAFKGAMPDDMFKPTKTLAANQGLYNGFLAAGLIWSFFITDPLWQKNVALFFLGCVVVAGVYGAATASRKIFFIQALPAVIAFVFVWLAGRAVNEPVMAFLNLAR
jgi:putative membrane protein